ncbi:MAG: SH3 domain-containing protein [Chloroflexi bacterium]|nr:MAG: SH3 domain-containing protein [Chloroflexota bacterium]
MSDDFDMPDWLDNEDDSDEQTDDSSAQPQRPEGFGFTGELPWLQGDDDSAAGGVPSDDDLPEWMRDDVASDAGDDASDLPPWLQGASVPDEEQPVVDETGGLSEDFLSQADALPESVSSDLTYDEWAAIQEEVTRERDPEELIPDDLFDDIGAAAADDLPDSGVLPDWYLGLEDSDDDEAPEWLEQVGVSGDTTGSLGDILAGVDEPAPPPTPPEDVELPTFDFGGTGGGDFFSDIGDESPEPDLQDFFDNLADAAPANAEAEDVSPMDTGEFLSVLGFGEADTPPEDEGVARVDTDEFLSDLGLEAVDEVDESFEHVDTDDFLSNLGLEGTGETAEEYTGPPIQHTSDFLDQLGLTDEDAAPADTSTAFTEAIPGASDINTGELLGELGLDDFGEPSAEAEQPSPVSGGDTDEFLSSLGLSDEQEMPGELPVDEAFEQPSAETFFEEAAAPVEEEITMGEFFTEADDVDDDFDWFAETDIPVAETESMDWLENIDSSDYDAATEEDEILEDDFFTAQAGEQADLDTLIESMGEDVALPQSGMLATTGDDIDFDDLFDDPAFGDIEPEDTSFEMPEGVDERPALDILTELGVSVDEVSATAILRQQQDRDVTELDDRLQRLRERSADVTQPLDTSELIEVPDDPFAGIDDAILLEGVRTSRVEIDSPIILTPEQQQKADLLKKLGGGAEDSQPAAIDDTYVYLDDDEAFSLDEVFDELEAEAETAALKRRRGIFTGVRWERVAIGLILAIVVVLPFIFDDIDVGDLPPAAFEADSRQADVFERIDALNSDDLVLVAAEYGPTGAGELDDLTRVLSQHIFLRGARPLYVSTNPVGLLHVNNVVHEIGDDETFNEMVLDERPLIQNADYFVSRYLAASAIGLRAFGEDVRTSLETDIRGDALPLDVDSLDDFSLIIVIAERGEDVRAWAEQIVPLTNTTVLAATSAAAAPLTEPFMAEGEHRIQGMLVGFRDAYTYSLMLDALIADPSTQLTPRPTRVPPTQEPANQQAVDEETATPTMTPTPTEATPTRTPVPPTATPSPIPVITGVVTGTQDVNVRQNPTTNSPVVDIVSAGTQVTVLGESDDGAWVNVVTPKGVEGWMITTALDIQGAAPSSPPVVTDTSVAEMTLTVIAVTNEAVGEALTATADAQNVATNTPQPTNTPRPTNTPMPTATNTPQPAQPTDDPFAPTLTAVAVTNTAIADLAQTATAEAEARSGVVATGVISSNQTVNIRNGPSTQFPVVDLAPPGTELQILGQNAAGTWLNVITPNDIEGWVSASLVNVDADGDLPVIDPQSSSNLTIRFGRVLPGHDVKLQPTDVPVEETLTQIAATNAAIGDALTATAGGVDSGAQKPSATPTPPPPTKDEVDPALGTLTAVAVTNTAIANLAQTATAQAGGGAAKATATATQAVEAQDSPTPTQAEAEDSPTPTQAEVKDSPTATVSASATPTPTETPSGPTLTPTPEIEPSLSSFSNERWNAMTLGIIAATVIIGLGALVNIIRSISRRSRS